MKYSLYKNSQWFSTIKQSATTSEIRFCVENSNNHMIFKKYIEGNDNDNPLSTLPAEIKESIMSEFYEPNKTNIVKRYIENNYFLIERSSQLQVFMNEAYKYATRIKSHVLSNNLIVVLSILPYSKLGSWADMLALSATRSSFLDVQELGIQCFENWEDKSACDFLSKCHFEETWLQEYANAVCTYIQNKKDVSQQDLTPKTPWELLYQ